MSSSPVQHAGNKDELDAALKAHPKVMVDFFATWCGPCKMVAPMIEKWAGQYPAVTFIKVDVDHARDIAMHYEIRAMPTFIFFQNGSATKTIVGARVPDLEAAVKALAQA